MRTFMNKLLAGATDRLAEEPVIYGHGLTQAGEAITAALAAPETPKDFVKARSLLNTSITRLMHRRDVLVQEIEDRSAELYETNKTLEALSAAEHSIYEIGKADVSQAIAAGETEERYGADISALLFPAEKPTEELSTIGDLVKAGVLPEFKAKGESLLREATAAPSSDQITHLDARFRPKGFA